MSNLQLIDDFLEKPNIKIKALEDFDDEEENIISVWLTYEGGARSYIKKYLGWPSLSGVVKTRINPKTSILNASQGNFAIGAWAEQYEEKNKIKIVDIIDIDPLFVKYLGDNVYDIQEFCSTKGKRELEYRNVYIKELAKEENIDPAELIKDQNGRNKVTKRMFLEKERYLTSLFISKEHILFTNEILRLQAGDIGPLGKLSLKFVSKIFPNMKVFQNPPSKEVVAEFLSDANAYDKKKASIIFDN